MPAPATPGGGRRRAADRPREAAVGIDVGATLAKVALREADAGPARLVSFPASDLDAVCAEVEAARPAWLGVTGGGAPALAERLGPAPAAVRVDEFRAWGTGAELLVRDQGLAVEGRYLVVSLGTGTSILLVDGGRAMRVGGTALGGGTVVGLGAALLGRVDFDELCRLAAAGERRRVDLLVSDIYRHEQDLPLAGDLTAASFGKLARDGGAGRREDVAAAVMGLVGENVALICGGLAAATGARRVLFGGSTLRDNRALGDVLLAVSRLTGLEPSLLIGGEFAGALGALATATTRDTESAVGARADAAGRRGPGARAQRPRRRATSGG